jgi:hypothetical protein
LPAVIGSFFAINHLHDYALTRARILCTRLTMICIADPAVQVQEGGASNFCTAKID